VAAKSSLEKVTVTSFELAATTNVKAPSAPMVVSYIISP
jgi:hypothetical protein